MAEILGSWLESASLVKSDEDTARVRSVAPLVQTRIRRLTEAVDYCRPVLDGIELDPAAVDSVRELPWGVELASRMRLALAQIESWDRGHVERALRSVQESMSLNARKAFVIAYVAITGSRVSLPIFDVIAVIGRDTALRRLDQFLDVLGTSIG
jgi:glutamyl-tRNA synthetase